MHYRGISQEAMTVQAQYTEWLRRLQESRVAKLERQARGSQEEDRQAAGDEQDPDGGDSRQPAGNDASADPEPEHQPERFRASA